PRDIGRDEGIPHRSQDDGGLLRLLEEVLLGALERAEIANRHQRQGVLARTERDAVDFRRKVAPVPPSGEGADRGTLPRSGGRRLAAASAERVVYVLEGRGNQPTRRFAQELCIGPSEEAFGLSIQRRHPA